MNAAGKRGYCREEVPPILLLAPTLRSRVFVSAQWGIIISLWKSSLWRRSGKRGAGPSVESSKTRADVTPQAAESKRETPVRPGWGRGEGEREHSGCACRWGPHSCYWIARWVFGGASPPPLHLLHSHYIFVRNTTASVSRIYTGRVLYEQVCLKILNDAMKRVLLCLE